MFDEPTQSIEKATEGRARRERDGGRERAKEGKRENDGVSVSKLFVNIIDQQYNKMTATILAEVDCEEHSD